MRFGFEVRLPVRVPYRLDLTAEALRRLAANVVDVVDDGVYRRLLCDDAGANIVEVRQRSARAIDLRIAGSGARRWVPVVQQMLGTQVPLDTWYRRVKRVPWLEQLARELRGLKPPRYPDLWESLCHAIVFQQISIHAAASIMRRTIEALSEPVELDGRALYAFPRPHLLLRADDAVLRAAGLSANKIAHLRGAAQAMTQGRIDGAMIEALASEAAGELLCGIRGIGPWSAAVVLLRGFGRLDVFPMRDSGVARSIREISGDSSVDIGRVLAALGPTRGMLYFHLLLARLR